MSLYDILIVKFEFLYIIFDYGEGKSACVAGR